MRRRSIGGIAVGAVASLALAGSALGFSGLNNGSFESGTFSGALWDTLHPGSTSITGWSVDAGSIDWTGSYWPAADGSLSIDLSGDGPGSISQTFATTVGNTYTVTFALSGNPACGPAIKTLEVSATGGSTQPFTYDMSVAGNTFTDMKWATNTYSFVATAATTTLTFTSTTGGSCGPAIDNVGVTETAPTPEPPPVVEPATLADCKDGGWLTVEDAAGNAFRNQGDCVSYVATDHRNVAAAPPAESVAGPAAGHGRHAGDGEDASAAPRRSGAGGSADRATQQRPPTSARSDASAVGPAAAGHADAKGSDHH